MLRETLQAAQRRGKRNQGSFTESDVAAISQDLGDDELAGRLRAIAGDDRAGLLTDVTGPGATRFLAGVVGAQCQRLLDLEARLAVLEREVDELKGQRPSRT